MTTVCSAFVGRLYPLLVKYPGVSSSSPTFKFCICPNRPQQWQSTVNGSSVWLHPSQTPYSHKMIHTQKWCLSSLGHSDLYSLCVAEIKIWIIVSCIQAFSKYFYSRVDLLQSRSPMSLVLFDIQVSKITLDPSQEHKWSWSDGSHHLQVLVFPDLWLLSSPVAVSRHPHHLHPPALRTSHNLERLIIFCSQ